MVFTSGEYDGQETDRFRLVLLCFDLRNHSFFAVSVRTRVGKRSRPDLCPLLFGGNMDGAGCDGVDHFFSDNFSDSVHLCVFWINQLKNGLCQAVLIFFEHLSKSFLKAGRDIFFHVVNDEWNRNPKDRPGKNIRRPMNTRDHPMCGKEKCGEKK